MVASAILREYEPVECDANGVPVDWERCRGLDSLDGGMGSLHEALYQRREKCPWCDGHDSLKAAALAYRAMIQHKDRIINGISYTLRCEGCGHRMSEGTWEDRSAVPRTSVVSPERFEDVTMADAVQAHWQGWALSFLLLGKEPPERSATDRFPVHYSPCDEGCRHGGPGRFQHRDGNGWVPTTDEDHRSGGPYVVEASWRQVDVRLGKLFPGFDPRNPLHVRPFDLRPENLSVLCLRCRTDRMKEER